MFKHYLITAWRNLIKNGLFSGINIFGLAIGLMSCILILLFVRNESGYDQWFEGSEQVVRLHSGFHMPNRPPFDTVRSSGRMMEAIKAFASNEVQSGARVVQQGLSVQKGTDVYPQDVSMVDGSFLDIFPLDFIEGSLETSFKRPMDMLITRDLAIKYFGRTDVVGETLTLCCVASNPVTLPVSGVIQNLPENTHLNTDLLVYMQPRIFADSPNILESWGSLNVYTYFKLRQGATVEQLQERVNYWLNNESPFKKMYEDNVGELPSGMQISDHVKLRIMPVSDIHLHAKAHAGSMGDLTPLGDYNMIVTFVVVAALILLIACINFMNLATARASQRAREVAMRKVLGASRRQIALQFLGESVMLVIIALLFALAAVELILPFYSQLLGRELHLNLLGDLSLLATLLGLAIMVGVGAGIYPALFLSGYKPAQVLTSTKGAESSGSGKLRIALVIFQFAISVVLIIATLIVYGQTRYSTNIDVGYRYDNKLILNVFYAQDRLDALKQELEKLPQVKQVVYTSDAPTQDRENNRGYKLLASSDGKAGQPDAQMLNYYSTDYGFFNAYEIEPVAGRVFDPAYGSDKVIRPETLGQDISNASAIINQSAARRFGFNDPQQAIGRTLEVSLYENQIHHLTIIGVVPDVHFRSIKFSIRPSIYLLREDRFNNANIVFSGHDIPTLMQQVEQIWKKVVPMQPIYLDFLSEMMAAQYAEQATTAKLFGAFSLLAIVVACLGLYGLAAFTAERRTREIGIRKVMGAEVSDIVRLLVWQFSKPVMLAILLGWPVGILLMRHWLQDFPYRLDNWWFIPVCVLAGLLSLLVAWFTVGGNATRVARRNPVHSLRHE
ncbi:ABC transporter permease [Neptunicella marina]|uniref:ABC transporter permease n=2 Tax=Neptunicella marina TaxID=2125989 RepID=A0A8J6M3U1_9ALTE|nr:ABC transporter permease [Neptunicella marina]